MASTNDDITNSEFNIKLAPRYDKKEFISNWMADADFDAESVVSSEDPLNEIRDLESIKICDDDATLPKLTNGVNVISDNNVNILQKIFNSNHNIQTLGNINIESTSNLHIGNVIHVTGSIHITQIDPEKSSKNDLNVDPDQIRTSAPLVEKQENNTSSGAFLGNIERSIDTKILKIVDRRTWLAQAAMEPYEYLPKPADYVVISHTATEPARTQAESIYLIRHIQCFHIESRHWNDIAYNFIVSGDGNIYEGRGWGVVGAHAHGYNCRSVGISFLGCFMKELPPIEAREACRLLIKKGIDLKYIKPDYKLIGHCQCSPTESPGRTLFEEIKTWPNFSATS